MCVWFCGVGIGVREKGDVVVMWGVEGVDV